MDLPDSLTALHTTVLQNEYEKVGALLKSREYAVDVRSSTGATPLMIAALYGRTRIFFYLVKKKADVQKHDNQNLTALQYVKGPSIPKLVRRYQHVATGEPRRKGRHVIYHFLKTFEQANRSSQLQQPLDTRSPDMQLSRGNSLETHPPSTIFLRSQNGRQLELMGVQRLAIAGVDIDLGRKSTGTIRGKNEASDVYKFAISGWAGVNGEDVLCNREYSGLVRRVCALYNFKLGGNWLDNRWRGDPAEKRGSYLSSHAEKQLGIWVLVESLSQALGTKEITIESIARLKELSPELPARLRETQIQLDHEPCVSCINFLNMLRQKAGLVIEWKSRKWFVEGQRSRLRRRDGQPVTGGNSNNDDDDNMLDELDEDGYVSSVTMDSGDDHDDAATATATANTDAAVEDAAADPSPILTAAEGTHRQGQPRRHLRRHASDPYPKGRSPIVEPPTNRVPRWPVADVRPRPPTPFGESLRSRFGYKAANNVSRETSLEYEVERVVDFNPKDKEYKVIWTDESSTWEPVGNLANAQKAIDEYWQAIGSCEADEMMDDVELLTDDE